MGASYLFQWRVTISLLLRVQHESERFVFVCFVFRLRVSSWIFFLPLLNASTPLDYWSTKLNVITPETLTGCSPSLVGENRA